MSTWNIGKDDVSEETQAFKDQLASKDGQIAAYQTQLMKQGDELAELRAALHDAIYQSTKDSTRALELETTLHQRNEDLRNEKNASQNLQASLATAYESAKVKDQDKKELEAILDSMSHASSRHAVTTTKLEREKAVLEARVRELQGTLAQQQTPITPARLNVFSSPSPSGASVTTLGNDLVHARSTISQQASEFQTLNQKLRQTQADLMKMENEKAAMERRMNLQIADLQTTFVEKQQALSYLEEQLGDNSREEALLKRIEEDGAKIMALESLVRCDQTKNDLERDMRRLQHRLDEEQRKVIQIEEFQVELIKEKEEALDELEEARIVIGHLEERVRGAQACVAPLYTPIVKEVSAQDTSVALRLPDPPQPLADEAAVIYIERLLGAIDRLRAERDSLRRNIAFIESESKFTIEALEAKLSSSISTTTVECDSAATIGQMKAEMDELHAQLSALRRTEEQTAAMEKKIKQLNLIATTSLVVLAHVQIKADNLEDHQLAVMATRNDLRQQLDIKVFDLAEVGRSLKELEDKLDVTTLCLEAVTSQRDDLVIELAKKEAESQERVTMISLKRDEAFDNLNAVEQQLASMQQRLEDVVSERDSLNLSVTNLQADLHAAQIELSDAEKRYSSLQFHQLSDMSSNEATRALRDQIAELENRVLRRTEQIGIHQHDIRRLETNLRLQEERLNEMTSELEMMEAQKDAMVEDCADARETRDEALLRVEALEDEAEILEHIIAQGESRVIALITTVFDAVSQSRRALQNERHTTNASLSRMEAKHRADTTLINSLESDLRQSILALATAGVEARKCNILLHQLSEQVVKITDLDKALRVSEEQTSRAVSEVDQLKDLIAYTRDKHNVEILEATAEFNERLREANRPAENDVEQESELFHGEQHKILEEHLNTTSKTLEELQLQHAVLDADYQASKTYCAHLETELESNTQIMQEQSGRLLTLQTELEQVQKDNSIKIVSLEDALMVAKQATQEVQALCDMHRSAEGLLKNELAEIQLQYSMVAGIRAESLAEMQRLRGELESLRAQTQDQSVMLEKCMQDSTRLSEDLKFEVESHRRDQGQYDTDLKAAREGQAAAEKSVSKLQNETRMLSDTLEESRRDLNILKHEKVQLQQQLTTLEAEIQRSMSLCRFLETQVKESQETIIALNAELEATSAELARSEKSGKATQVNLSLQSVQHKREMADLRRELEALSSKPDLEEALVELENRNNDMEELLKAKCAEIEENDDRALEMLKENKKLTTRIESLSRKVQNLQAKLNAAKASNPGPQAGLMSTSPDVPASNITTATTTRQRSVTHSIPTLPPRISPSMEGQTLLSRTVSGPSSVPRSKTPERKALPVQVFKARTPERRSISSPENLSTTVIGKKRRAPDDFEDCESVPPQAFTAESVPRREPENRTPRVRRVLSSFQSGFTPIRQQGSHALFPISPDKKATNSPYITDMTNSPRRASQQDDNAPESAKLSKRSWLGKIRGSSQAPLKSGTTRGLFTRPRNDADNVS